MLFNRITRGLLEQGPSEYGDFFYNHIGRNGSFEPRGGSFNQSFPKNDVEWSIYNSQRTFPNGYPCYEVADPNAIAIRTGAAELSSKTWGSQSPRLWNRWYRPYGTRASREIPFLGTEVRQ